MNLIEEHPRVLVALATEKSANELLPALLEGGFRLHRVTSGRSALEQAANLQPDLILLDTTLPDLPVVEIARTLLAGHRVSTTTPVLFVTAEPPTFEQRLDPVRAGARDCVGPWMEGEALRQLCRALVEAKREADRGAAESLFDPATGLYSWQGLVRRARELGSLATRQHQGLACVVFNVAVPGDSAEVRAATAVRCARDAQEAVRLCDAVGRPGNSEFAVLAPATDAAGAVGLAARLAVPIRSAAASALALPTAEVEVRAGYEAVANLAYTPIDPATLLLRAGTALRTGEAEPRRSWLRHFVERDRA